MSNGLLHRSQLQLIQKCAETGNGQLRCLINIDAAHRNCQGAGFQALALACLTRRNAHKALILCLGCLGEGFLVAALHIAEQALKCHRIDALAPLSLVIHLHLFSIGTVQDHILDFLRILLKRCIQVKVVFLT